MASFLDPEYDGLTHMTIPSFGFLIEHPTKKLMFDLGVRKNWQTLPPKIVSNIKSNGWKVNVSKDIADILSSHGVQVDEIIWSHHHWDHTGDISLFPATTPLVIGPGFRDQYLPGHPENPDGQVNAADFKSRPVREVSFPRDLKIGRFEALDYFGDGSFYLLDTPGHSVGHMCGLARTTPDSFVFMGGDACHHAGEFRPTEYLPLPGEVTPWPKGGMCPGHLLRDVQRNGSATEPFFRPSKKSAHDLAQCERTVEGLCEFDAQDNVFVLLAHDSSVLGQVTLFPETMNDWYEKGLAKQVKWRFLGDFAEAVEHVKAD